MTILGVPEHIKSYRYYRDSPELWSGDIWEARNADFKPLEKPQLAEGLPTKLEGPLVWKGQELSKTPDKYLYRLNDAEKDLIDDALRHFESLGKPLDQISSETFPLHEFGETLNRVADQIYNGIGFSVIRGLDIDKYNEKQRAIIYLGISSYIGDIRDAQGINRALTHIKSIAHIPRDKRAIITVSQQTTDPQMFHNDFGLDIVSLIVLDVPKEGGESLITSTYTVYNELAQERPDLINLLAKESAFEYSRKSSVGATNLVSYVDGRFFSHFSTRAFIGFGETERDPKVPPLNDKQRDSFGAFHWVGYKNSLALQLEKGDLEYLNNFYLQHCRHGYTEDSEHRRHIARLWLRNSKHSGKIKLPDILQEKKESFFPVHYEQKIPINVQEEEQIKLDAKIDSLDSLYAKPK